MATLDYQRFGRQIALPELGADGQERLGASCVRFEHRSPAVVTRAERLHTNAGGGVERNESRTPSVEVRIVEAVEGESASFLHGIAAWAAVEAARRVLGQTPADPPPVLLARLTPPGERSR